LHSLDAARYTNLKLETGDASRFVVDTRRGPNAFKPYLQRWIGALQRATAVLACVPNGEPCSSAPPFAGARVAS
jgi:hypothetical protein